MQAPQDSTVTPPEDTSVRPPDVIARDTAARDAVSSMDVTQDSGVCDPDMCFDSCLAVGALTGRCRLNMCSCLYPDGGGPSTDAATAADAVVDVPRESSVRVCLSNMDCPSSQYCNGPTCEGVGFCSLRLETDVARCPRDEPSSCGCDGVTYSSVCARSVAGVRQDSARRCVVDGGAADAARD